MPSDNAETIRTVVVVLGFLVGGGFLFELVRDLGGLEVKVGTVEGDVKELKEKVETAPGYNAAPANPGDPVFDNARFQERILAQVHYLVGKTSEVQVPGFLEMEETTRERAVKCLAYHLALWEVSQACLHNNQDIVGLGCVDQDTGTPIKVPAEVKKLVVFCAVQ